MAKPKTTQAKTTASPKKSVNRVTKKKVDISFDWSNVGENVMRNAERISANIRANADRIGNNVRALMDR